MRRLPAMFPVGRAPLLAGIAVIDTTLNTAPNIAGNLRSMLASLSGSRALTVSLIKRRAMRGPPIYERSNRSIAAPGPHPAAAELVLKSGT